MRGPTYFGAWLLPGPGEASVLCRLSSVLKAALPETGLLGIGRIRVRRCQTGRTIGILAFSPNGRFVRGVRNALSQSGLFVILAHVRKLSKLRMNGESDLVSLLSWYDLNA